MLKSVMAVVLFMCLVSCNNDESSVELGTQNLESIKFKQSEEVKGNSKMDPVVDISWGRKDYDCHGWGVCIIFESDQIGKVNGNTENSIKVGYTKENGVVKMLLELSEPTKLDLTKHDLIVSEDIKIDFKNDNSKIVKAKNYKFNPNLGKFGGYEIIGTDDLSIDGVSALRLEIPSLIKSDILYNEKDLNSYVVETKIIPVGERSVKVTVIFDEEGKVIKIMSSNNFMEGFQFLDSEIFMNVMDPDGFKDCVNLCGGGTWCKIKCAMQNL